MRSVVKSLAMVLAVALVLLIGLAATVVSSFSGLAPIQEGRIVDGVETVKDGIVSCFIVDLNDREVALIDACNDHDATAILAALKRRGLGVKAVRAIVLTHGDVDHVAGAAAFPEAEVLVPAADLALAEGREARGIFRIFGAKPTGLNMTRTLGDGEHFSLAGVTFRVYSIPGHTRGSIAILARGVLFVGDSAETRSDGTLAPGKRLTSDDPAENRATLRQLAKRLQPSAAEVKAIAPAHSGVLHLGLTPLLEFQP